MTTNEDGVIRALDEAVSAGLPWVCYDDQDNAGLHPLTLHFFATAGEAERFCDDLNSSFDYVEQVFNFFQYRYTSAAALSKNFQAREQKLESPTPDLIEINEWLIEQKLHLPSGQSVDELEAALAGGHVYPVIRERVIEPLREIEFYHVIAHRHIGGQIYELGHTQRIMASFSNVQDARYFMDSAVLFDELAEKPSDFLVVGQFGGRPLELDLEGYAMPHSGLTILTAQHNNDNGHDYVQQHSLSEAAVFDQYFFLGIHNGSLQLYDDKLERTTIANSQRPFYITNFKYDYFTFKISNKMINESSYDYVKNQLLYLGFGEEIAQPLRDKMEQNLAEFTLPHSRKFGPDETHSVLHFSKGDQKDMTFFNRFDLTLKQEGKENLTQTFFVGKEYNYTLQERYNMLDGRFVYREQPKMKPVEENGETKMVPTGETYLGWKGLNFKETDRHGNFLPKTMFWNHEKEIMKYPVKELLEPYDKNRMLTSLQKGNKVNVTIIKDEQELRAVVAANPRMQRLDFYDEGGQALMVRKVEQQNLSITGTLGTKQAAENQKTEGFKQANSGQSVSGQSNADQEQVGKSAQRKKQGLQS